MRRHGWKGDLPTDDTAAAARIVSAAREAIDAHGTVSVSQVAQALGVTRPTVYRYFPTLESLLQATAMSATSGFLNHLAEHLRHITDPTEAVVEGIAYTLEQLPQDRYLNLVLQPGKGSAYAAGVTSDVSIAFGRSILERNNVDWAAAGFTDESLNELVEFMLRILLSFVVDPGGPTRHDDELRGYLYRWVSPAVEARNSSHRIGHPQTANPPKSSKQ
ncbi:MAG: TetR/AcrR family transcriptional regulator [Mycobacterium sp.]|nr:TetR/AcrR family transcriptional regulator [Mycobacterium sp.]